MAARPAAAATPEAKAPEARFCAVFAAVAAALAPARARVAASAALTRAVDAASAAFCCAAVPATSACFKALAAAAVPFSFAREAPSIASTEAALARSFASTVAALAVFSTVVAPRCAASRTCLALASGLPPGNDGSRAPSRPPPLPPSAAPGFFGVDHRPALFPSCRACAASAAAAAEASLQWRCLASSGKASKGTSGGAAASAASTTSAARCRWSQRICTWGTLTSMRSSRGKPHIRGVAARPPMGVPTSRQSTNSTAAPSTVTSPASPSPATRSWMEPTFKRRLTCEHALPCRRPAPGLPPAAAAPPARRCGAAGRTGARETSEMLMRHTGTGSGRDGNCEPGPRAGWCSGEEERISMSRRSKVTSKPSVMTTFMSPSLKFAMPSPSRSALAASSAKFVRARSAASAAHSASPCACTRSLATTWPTRARTGRLRSERQGAWTRTTSTDTPTTSRV
mmetsp:Transcript_89434/g.289253  ORF Transcript_89434/g.289253 Transcript_89434/m.289253 type:complete len:457 (+) Transcript_89434:519-1889(+)